MMTLESSPVTHFLTYPFLHLLRTFDTGNRMTFFTTDFILIHPSCRLPHSIFVMVVPELKLNVRRLLVANDGSNGMNERFPFPPSYSAVVARLEFPKFRAVHIHVSYCVTRVKCHRRCVRWKMMLVVTVLIWKNIDSTGSYFLSPSDIIAFVECRIRWPCFVGARLFVHLFSNSALQDD